MSLEAVSDFVGSLVRDAAFRARADEDFDRSVHGLDLTAEERVGLREVRDVYAISGPAGVVALKGRLAGAELDFWF